MSSGMQTAAAAALAAAINTVMTFRLAPARARHAPTVADLHVLFGPRRV